MQVCKSARTSEPVSSNWERIESPDTRALVLAKCCSNWERIESALRTGGSPTGGWGSNWERIERQLPRLRARPQVVPAATGKELKGILYDPNLTWTPAQQLGKN
jgi:hypothetical protein